MKKTILAFIFLMSVFTVFTACEDDKKNSDFLMEEGVVVATKSFDVISYKEGDVYQFQGDKWRIIVTDKTDVFFTRDSCSGLNRASYTEIKTGHTIFFSYKPQEVIFEDSYKIVRPKRIEGYKPECLQISPSGEVIITTNVVTSTNTTTTTTTTITTNVIRRNAYE
jgi:hypothetical protein